MKTINAPDANRNVEGLQEGVASDNDAPGKAPGNRRRIALLFGLCTLGCMFSAWLIVTSVRSGTANVLSVSPIKVPAYIQLPVDSLSVKANDQNIKDIRRLAMYMDSLARSPGRHLYDSLLKAQPNLRENLDYLKSLCPEFSNEFLITK